jgi:hypothetical protein
MKGKQIRGSRRDEGINSVMSDFNVPRKNSHMQPPLEHEVYIELPKTARFLKD